MTDSKYIQIATTTKFTCTTKQHTRLQHRVHQTEILPEKMVATLKTPGSKVIFEVA